MATITVTNLNDSGAGSLRQAVLDANASVGVADTIVFQAGLTGTITLTAANNVIAITDDLTINGDNTGDNKADIIISGGGVTSIFAQSGTQTDVDLKSLTLTNGFTRSGQGGAITVREPFGGGTLDISDTTIQNSNGDFAGGLYVNNAVVTVTNSLFTGNYSSTTGGAITQVGGNSSITLVNTTVHDNSAFRSGGLDFFSSSGNAQLTLVSSTVTGNSSILETGLGGAGGIRDNGGVLTITNSVVADNVAGSGGTPAASDVGGTVDTGNNSVFGTAVTITTGSGNQTSVADVGLGALADNGGTTQTQNILAGSVLFDAGGNPGAAGISTDANGGPRITGDHVDVGATEAGRIVVTTLADTVNAGDGVTSLREAVALANATADLKVIAFAANLAGQITLGVSGELAITGFVVIDGDTNGDNEADIKVSGGGASRIFNITTADSGLALHSLTIADGNTAGDGGAILAVAGANVSLRDTTLQANDADGRGGAITMLGGLLTAVNSTISGNSAGDFGGGVYAVGSTVNMTNTTISGNATNSLGGGVSLNSSAITLINSTVTANLADADGAMTTHGGGIEDFGSTLTIVNSVVADNFSGTGNAENDVLGDVDTATNSAFGAATSILAGAGNITVAGSAGLGQLLDNGGTTLTHSPLDGSVLIGAGSNAALALDVFDLDGDGNRLEQLPLDGRGGIRVAGAAADIGAVEQILDETIGGTAGDNILIGGFGNDVLRGRAGNDTLDGGSGNDTANWTDATGAIVFTLDVNGNGVTANVAGIGIDTLIGIENLTGGGANDTLTGNGEANILNGGLGNDRMTGGGGGDTYVLNSSGDATIEALGGGGGDKTMASITHALRANIEELVLTGTANINGTGNILANTITGNSGSNILNGLAGADAMVGLGGNDTYNVDNLLDTASEAGGSGVDIVRSTVDFTLDAGIEKLYLLETAINGTGNALSNFIYGNASANVIDGKGGADRLFGGTGNDTYVVDSSGDLVFETTAGAAGGSADLVQSSVNHTLANNVENLTLTGVANIKATGNTIINTVSGNTGNNLIDGRLGSDILTGGGGSDQFLFTTALGAANIDTIADFDVANDFMRLDDAIFAGIALGYLTGTSFVIGAAAADVSDRIVYNSATGALLFDSDGTGAAAAKQFANIGAGLALSAGDFFVF